MKKKEIQQNLLNKHSDLLYVLLFAFGGACSKRQLLTLEEATEPLLKDLITYNIIKVSYIDKKAFIICKNAVFKHFGINQNYRLNAYNLKKSCLLAEYWLLCHNNAETIIKTINKGNLHQYKPKQYTDYITYLHTQNCYIRFLTDNPRTIHFVYFPKSSNPKTIAIFIRNFYNNIVAADTNTIYRLSIRLYDEEQKNRILRHIDGRYWYILNKIHFFKLNCIDILNII